MGMLSDRCSGRLGGGTDDSLSSAPRAKASHPRSAEGDPVLAAADRMNRAIRKLFDGWKNGDFDLPELAEKELGEAYECAVAYARIRSSD